MQNSGKIIRPNVKKYKITPIIKAHITNVRRRPPLIKKTQKAEIEVTKIQNKTSDIKTKAVFIFMFFRIALKKSKMAAQSAPQIKKLMAKI